MKAKDITPGTDYEIRWAGGNRRARVNEVGSKRLPANGRWTAGYKDRVVAFVTFLNQDGSPLRHGSMTPMHLTLAQVLRPWDEVAGEYANRDAQRRTAKEVADELDEALAGVGVRSVAWDRETGEGDSWHVSIVFRPMTVHDARILAEALRSAGVGS